MASDPKEEGDSGISMKSVLQGMLGIFASERGLNRATDARIEVLVEMVGNLQEKVQALTDAVHLIHSEPKEPFSPTEDLKARLESLLDFGIPWLSDDPNLVNNPEFLLLAYLYSFLPSRIAIDVGANQGELSKLLLQTGYRVFAFEPYPPVLEKLRESLGENPEMTIFGCALGAQETKLPLHVATLEKELPIGDGSLYNTFRPHFISDGVNFSSYVEVSVRTLSSLVAEGVVPNDVSLLKIDTEGFDLEVIRGMGDIRPSVVHAEFWGDEFVFVRYEGENRPVSSAEIISEMRSRDYRWNLILFRIEGEYAIRFAPNLANAPKRAWGNILFFQDFNLFSTAFRWCQAALPRLQGTVMS